MSPLFLSYARADGLHAAERLRSELTAMGFAVWRDVEEMRGGQAWRRQLLQALQAASGVLLLLTPGAVASQPVTWEWQTALALGRRVIPLLISDCEVPAELKALHYHRLDTQEAYTLGLARLTRDLLTLPAQAAAPPSTTGGGSTYQVGTAINSAVGDRPVVVNAAGGGEAAGLAQILAFLLRQDRSALSPEQSAELQTILRQMQAQTE